MLSARENIILPEALNILIGGEAGQGLVTVGQLLAKSLVRSGYHIVVTQSYQSRIRGGHNSFAVRASQGRIFAPREPMDLLVAMDAETVEIERGDLSAHGLVLAGEELSIREDGLRMLRIPFKQLATGKAANVAALGIVGCLVGLDEGLVAGCVEDFFGKHPEDIEENRKALSAAYEWSSKQDVPVQRLTPVAEPLKRMMIHGNDGIALGAMSAGVKFCSFYPMTPATSIPLDLAEHSKRMGLVVEQAEDEIAAINMAIGASFAGAPSMTATSGGGFALMIEGVSLAAMTETPLVVVVSQRPGPATGLPTRTEQADLEMVLHAGHGEFPRAIFSPGTVEECFHLTRRAFELAERYQGPMFILTDQFLADSYRAVEPFDMERLPQVMVADRSPGKQPYRRYALTNDGISPRVLPGTPRYLVVADSDEHTEDGHLTEDLTVRNLMVQKRLKKGEGLRAEVIPPSYEGDRTPDLLMVCWGSTRGSVYEAMSLLREKGEKLGMLHFSQVWPMVPSHFVSYLESARRVVCVEGNAGGHLARLIRRESGFEIGEKVLRFDGLPVTPEFVLRGLAG